MNKEPFAAYSQHELQSSWRKRRRMKEWLDRVSGMIADQMQIIERDHQGQLPTDEAIRAVEEMCRQTLRMLHDRAASMTCDPVALIPVNLSRETLLALEAGFLRLAGLVQIELKTVNQRDTGKYLEYKSLPLDQYLQLISSKERAFPVEAIRFDPMVQRAEDWKNILIEISQHTLAPIAFD